MDHILGIDFGTSNSTVYVFKNGEAEALTDENGSSLFPSYVMYYNNKVVTGLTAKKQMGGINRTYTHSKIMSKVQRVES